ncbi:MAG: lactate utilization protein, partial [candidate division WOR-3 bacterium]|nr:lactate utilization protein [candidate division WOR-3 bacterium]
MKQNISSLIEKLGKNNISALYVQNRMQAFEKVMSMIPEGSVVGFGDSVTLRQIGVVEALEKG